MGGFVSRHLGNSILGRGKISTEALRKGHVASVAQKVASRAHDQRSGDESDLFKSLHTSIRVELEHFFIFLLHYSTY